MLPTRKSVPRSSHIRTTRRPPGHRKETQTAVVWSCLRFIRSGQNHFARHTVKGGRRQGRQKIRWEDNIREWTGLEFSRSQRAVENMEKWRKLVTKSSVMPQRPSRLRDKWDEMRLDEMRDCNQIYTYPTRIIMKSVNIRRRFGCTMQFSGHQKHFEKSNFFVCLFVYCSSSFDTLSTDDQTSCV